MDAVDPGARPRRRHAGARRASRTAKRISRWRSSPSPALADSFDVVEVNPVLDRENATGKLAVELVASALGARHPLGRRENRSTASATSSNGVPHHHVLARDRDDLGARGVRLELLLAHEPVRRARGSAASASTASRAAAGRTRARRRSRPSRPDTCAGAGARRAARRSAARRPRARGAAAASSSRASAYASGES